MNIGDLVRISPHLTHFPDWVIGKITEVDLNPFVGVVVTAETEDGSIFFGYEYLFKLV